MSKDLDIICEIIFDRLAKPEVINIIQPVLLFLTSNKFNKMDQYIRSINEISQKNKVMDNNKYVNQNLTFNIQKQFSNIYLSIMKIERDELRTDFYYLAKSCCKKAIREQRSVLGCWFNKDHEKYQNSLFSYVTKQYIKLTRKCPLYKKLSAEKTLVKNPFNEFVKLCMKKDKLGRSMKLKQFKNIESNETIIYTYRYLRILVLKKFLIKALLKKGIYIEIGRAHV